MRLLLRHRLSQGWQLLRVGPSVCARVCESRRFTCALHDCSQRSRAMDVLAYIHDQADSLGAHLGAYPDNARNHLQLYSAINREIGQRLAVVGADPVATDAARYVRVPGSFRNDVEEIVLWQWEDASGGAIPSYSLLELGEKLGLKRTEPRKQVPKASAGGKCPQRRGGFLVANANKLAAFRSLQEQRGGFVEGKRSIAAFILAVSLKWTGHARTEAVRELEIFGRACHPPFPVAECHSAVKSAYKKKSKTMRYCWMADQLDITPTEAGAISEAIGKPFPAAGRYGGQLIGEESRVGPRAVTRMSRRLEIQRIVDLHRHVPSSRTLRDMLLCAGLDASHVTVMADLRAMGLISESTKDKPARPCSPARASSLISAVFLESLFSPSLQVSESIEMSSTSLIASKTEQPA